MPSPAMKRRGPRLEALDDVGFPLGKNAGLEIADPELLRDGARRCHVSPVSITMRSPSATRSFNA